MRGGAWAAGASVQSQVSAEMERQALAILKQPDWHDFGPTFAAEQLAKRHQIQVGKETLRGVDDGSRIVEEQIAPAARGARLAAAAERLWGAGAMGHLGARRAEGRGPVRYLVRMIDDATSWSWGRFVERDATRHNMGVLWSTWRKMGARWMSTPIEIPCSRFRRHPERAPTKQRQADRLTQLGRALRELGIGSILAYSPQAKGRIERSFLTAQDRLVKLSVWRRSRLWKAPMHFWRKSIGPNGTRILPGR